MEKPYRLEQVGGHDLQEALDSALREMSSYGAHFDDKGEIAAVATVFVTAQWCADHGVPRRRLIAAIDEAYCSCRRLRLANP
jgi:hypothetical protein